MDYKEKVRLAKEALESGSYDKETIEYIFPELKESEDERIRKEIIDIIDSYDAAHLKAAGLPSRIPKYIAWLEKQGEYKPEWTPMDEQRVENLLAIVEGHGYPGEVAWLKSLKNRVQPKQEWSEKDRRMLIGLIDELDAIMNKATPNEISIYSKYTNWLKSLRPQNWTKEDKERYISCLQRLSTGNSEQPETINSKWFKEHVYPQTTWKPSDEQMNTLEHYIHTLVCNEHKKILFGLYADLKKLRGE